MGYIFMTPQKIKSTGKLTRAYDHNMRFRFCQNTDESKKHENIQVVARDCSYTEFYKRRIKETGRYSGSHAKKIRSNAVHAIDVMIAVERNEERNNPHFDVGQFCELAKQWVFQTFGEQNVAGMTLHKDETGLHIHSVVIPITEDGRLSCSDFIGTPQKLSHLQDTIAEAMSPIHLDRGRRHSVATHEKIKAHYGAIEEARTDSLPIAKENESAEEYSIRANRVFNDEKSRHLNVITQLEREINALKTQIKQRELEREEKEKEAEAMRGDNDLLKLSTERLKASAKQYSLILSAISKGVLPPDQSRQLFELMTAAVTAMETREREREEDRPENKK